LVYFLVFWLIFTILVCCTKTNLATLHEKSTFFFRRCRGIGQEMWLCSLYAREKCLCTWLFANNWVLMVFVGPGVDAMVTIFANSANFWRNYSTNHNIDPWKLIR
jgi:hypothetical protein